METLSNHNVIASQPDSFSGSPSIFASEEFPLGPGSDDLCGTQSHIGLDQPECPLPECIQPLSLLEQHAPGDDDSWNAKPSANPPGPKEPPQELRRSSRQKKNDSTEPAKGAGSNEIGPKEGDGNEEEGEDGKTQLRARNRKAAAKFRVRKKHNVDQLQEKEEGAREINRLLSDEASRLRHETLHLKSMVLEHAGCGCPHIDDYIQHAASSWVASPSSKSAPSSSSTSGELGTGVDESSFLE